MKFIYTRIKDEIRIDQIEDPEAVIMCRNSLRTVR